MDFTQLKQLFTDEDAVSPVIGVILMVAITVILAAVIGTFVLGLGDNVQDSAPQANFQFEYSGDFAASAGEITITHTGGEDVKTGNVDVLVSGAKAFEGSDGSSGTGWSVGAASNWGSGTSTIETGSALVLQDGDATDESGDTVRVVWTSPSGSNSNTIGQSTVPS